MIIPKWIVIVLLTGLLVFSVWQPIVCVVSSVLIGMLGGVCAYIYLMVAKRAKKMLYNDSPFIGVDFGGPIGSAIIAIFGLISMGFKDYYYHGCGRLALWQAAVMTIIVMLVTVRMAVSWWHSVTHDLRSKNSG